MASSCVHKAPISNQLNRRADGRTQHRIYWTLGHGAVDCGMQSPSFSGQHASTEEYLKFGLYEPITSHLDCYNELYMGVPSKIIGVLHSSVLRRLDSAGAVVVMQLLWVP